MSENQAERDRRPTRLPAGLRRRPQSKVPDIHADDGEFQRLPGSFLLRDFESFPMNLGTTEYRGAADLPFLLNSDTDRDGSPFGVEHAIGTNPMGRSTEPEKPPHQPSEWPDMAEL